VRVVVSDPTARPAPEATDKSAAAPRISVLTASFNEAENLPVLYGRLREVLDPLGVAWEWIVVDDHSVDDSYEIVQRMAEQDERVRGCRFSRNFGSHAAITCGFHRARGDCAIVIAADLQDPPDEIPRLLVEWEKGAQIVWAVRAAREGESVSTRLFSRVYYALMRRTSALREMPASGADFLLADQVVLEAFRQFREANVSIFALIKWMGFRQAFIAYDRQERLYGESGWTLRKKLKLFVDSLASFTYLPIRLMSYLGFAVALMGFVYAGMVLVTGVLGEPVAGWSSLMVAVLLLGGAQMLMLGVLGEYLWRALDESRRRPRYVLEGDTDHRSPR
jgi:dolichol-phosphate mannosyltransferase